MAFDDKDLHMKVYDQFDFDHQVLAVKITAGEAMALSGHIAPAVMIQGNEFKEANMVEEKSQKWVFVIKDPMQMLDFWIATGQTILQEEIWTKIKKVLDE